MKSPILERKPRLTLATATLGVFSAVGACSDKEPETNRIDDSRTSAEAGTGAPGGLASCSTKGETPTSVTFVNQRKGPVSLYWANERCVEVFYKTLVGGETGAQASFVGHMWRVREGSGDPNGTVLKEFTPQPSDAPSVTVIIPPPSGEAATVCSAPSTTPATVTVVNQRSADLSLFWVDTKCAEVFRGAIGRGREMSQATFVGHLFRVREGTQAAPGTLVREFVAATDGAAGADAGAPDAAAGGAVVTITPENGQPATVCSGPGSAPLTLTVNNAGAGPVSLYWIDATCTPLFRQTVPAAGSVSQSTYAGHVWQIRDGAEVLTGAVLRQFVPRPTDAPAMTVSVP